MIVFMILLVFPLFFIASALNPQVNQTVNISDFLVWLAAGGSAVAVSWFAERIPKFQALPSDTRRYIQYAASFLLAVAAFVVNTYVPEAYLVAAAPYFAIAAGLFGVFFMNQASHVLDPAKYRKKE